MQVRVWVRRKIVVDSKVNAFDIDTTPEDIGRDANSLVEFLELLVASDAVANVSTIMDDV